METNPNKKPTSIIKEKREWTRDDEKYLKTGLLLTTAFVVAYTNLESLKDESELIATIKTLIELTVLGTAVHHGSNVINRILKKTIK